MNKIAIIAGISGQDGFYLSKKLLKKKYKIIGLSRKKIYQKKIKIIKTRYSYNELVKIIKKYKPNVIYNFAGESNPRKSWKKINQTQKSIINKAKSVGFKFVGKINMSVCHHPYEYLYVFKKSN